MVVFLGSSGSHACKLASSCLLMEPSSSPHASSADCDDCRFSGGAEPSPHDARPKRIARPVFRTLRIRASLPLLWVAVVSATSRPDNMWSKMLNLVRLTALARPVFGGPGPRPEGQRPQRKRGSSGGASPDS